MFCTFIFPAVGLFHRVVHPIFQGRDKNNARGAIHQVRTKTADRTCSLPSCPNEMELVFVRVVLHSPPKSDEQPATRKDNPEYKSRYYITFINIVEEN